MRHLGGVDLSGALEVNHRDSVGCPEGRLTPRLYRRDPFERARLLAWVRPGQGESKSARVASAKSAAHGAPSR